MVKLCLRLIESDLSAENQPVIPAGVPPDERNPWKDSSLDLKRGLDVIELPVDIPVDGEQKLP